MGPIIVIVALALSLAGIALAHRAWRRRTSRPFAAGLVLCALATLVWILGFGAEIGIPLAIDTGSIAAIAFIVARAERRTMREPKERDVAPTPLTAGHRLRGTARTLLAGPVGLVAAIAVGVAIAIAAPMNEQTRLILAGLLVPSLWAGAMVWALAARRLLRPTLGLAALSAAGAAGAAVALMPHG